MFSNAIKMSVKLSSSHSGAACGMQRKAVKHKWSEFCKQTGGQHLRENNVLKTVNPQ